MQSIKTLVKNSQGMQSFLIARLLTKFLLVILILVQYFFMKGFQENKSGLEVCVFFQ